MEQISSIKPLAGTEVDLAPWAYLYRADLKSQKQPEAYFIPRRLERLNAVYRKDSVTVPQKDLKSWFYDQPDLLKKFPPEPKGKLAAGLLWTGGLVDYRVELVWPKGAPIPPANKVDVRAYPTAFGWFGWTVDKVLGDPTVSEDGRTWIYKSDLKEMMDTAYSQRIPAATEMLAVFIEGDDQPIPTLRVVGPSLGVWKEVALDIEWGFEDNLRQVESAVKLEPHIAVLSSQEPLDGSRRGVRAKILYNQGRQGLDSRVTVRLGGKTVTFAVNDVLRGPVYIPSCGLYVAKSDSGQTALSYVNDLKKKNLKSISQLTRERREPVTFEELMNDVRLWTMPTPTQLKPFVPVPDPAVSVELPDKGWTDAWRSATNQLRGRHMWGTLAFEVGRVAHEMEMIGLHAEADKIYDIYMNTPGMQPDGDYADGNGAFEIANAIKHGMGYGHEGTHPSTGRVLFAMCERYMLTGDKEWFAKRKDRMKQAADWIIRQRKTFMADVPNRKDLLVAGLTPPEMLGDYALPACDWHWYYVSNALSLQGIQRFADAMKDFDPKLAEIYAKEASDYRKDIQRVVKKDADLTPVRLGRDGAYHRYIPRMPYAKGLTGPELGAPQFPDCDMFMGPLPLVEPFSAVDANDPRIADSLMLMEEMGTSPAAIEKNQKERLAKGLPADDAWFSTCYVILPKASHNANAYLYRDDIPNFLRFWSNAYASVVGADGKLWEHWHLGNYSDCEAPDNGTAGWFMELFRNMLMMEVGGDLWIARGTPRAWLEQGKRIAVKNAPTYFGDLAYEIVSDVAHGTIRVSVDIPSRRPPKSVVVRLRHPSAAPIKSVTVNGKPWKGFEPKKETITLKGLSGHVEVVTSY